MRVEWVLLAEALVQDGRGVWVAVGMNQNVLAYQELPATTGRGALARIAGVPPRRTLSFRWEVTSPTGKVLVAEQAQVTLGDARVASVPNPGIDLPVQFILTLEETGAHEIAIEVSDKEAGEQIRGSVLLYVVSVDELSGSGLAEVEKSESAPVAPQ